MSFTVEVSMNTITCCATGCGIVFAVPHWWEVKRRGDHTSWYCPNGHPQSYSGENKEERLKRELLEARERADLAERELRSKSALLTAERTKSKRLRNRVKAGVCPAGCKRHFTNLERHIASKHPGYGG